MVSSEVLRGCTELMILRVLLDSDSYGYEISKSITELSNSDFVMKETTLYSAFKRLEKDGYVTSYPGTRTGGKPRTYLHITTEGRTYYHDKCSEWNDTKILVDQFIR